MRLKAPPRVLLADDHARVISVLKRLLAPSCEVVACVSDGAALLEAEEKLRPDIIVIDVFMPKVDGLSACRQIRIARPAAKIVIITGNNDSTMKQRALDAGASAFIPKHLIADDLLNVIHGEAEES